MFLYFFPLFFFSLVLSFDLFLFTRIFVRSFYIHAFAFALFTKNPRLRPEIKDIGVRHLPPWPPVGPGGKTRSRKPVFHRRGPVLLLLVIIIIIDYAHTQSGTKITRRLSSTPARKRTNTHTSCGRTYPCGRRRTPHPFVRVFTVRVLKHTGTTGPKTRLTFTLTPPL